jgi:hypothetical protein
MNKLFYFPKARINSKIIELVNTGNHITVNGYTYENLIRRPKGRSVYRKFRSLDEKTHITIYS